MPWPLCIFPLFFLSSPFCDLVLFFSLSDCPFISVGFFFGSVVFLFRFIMPYLVLLQTFLLGFKNWFTLDERGRSKKFEWHGDCGDRRGSDY